jgi:Tfp pilus assembly protein PilX
VRIYHLVIRRLGDERGIALPMALLALLILSTLVIAFALLATSEPLVATNQKMVAQARAVAESGLEKAIWALNNPTDPNGLSAMPGASPYDGSTDIAILDSSGTQIGVARVTVTQGTNTNERNVVSVGWVPTNPGKAHQKIQATVSKFLFKVSPPPAALTVAGEISAGGNVNINSRTDVSCGNKDGTWSQGATTTGGSATIYGADAGANWNVANQSASGMGPAITDTRLNVPTTAFDPYILKNADMNTLKAYAMKNGTYFTGAAVQGLTFNSGHQLPNGIIFIDTVSGNNIDYNADGTPCAGCTSTSDFASVDIHGGFAADPSGIFSGMIVVAGSLAIDGNVTMHGMVYTVNDLTYVGTGNGEIDGAVFSQNVRDVSSTTIDTNAGGNAQINYNCNFASNPGGQLPQGFSVVPGTYKEVSGS